MSPRLLLLFCLLCASMGREAFAGGNDKRQYELIPAYSPVEGIKLSLETNLNHDKLGNGDDLFSNFNWQLAGAPQDTLDWGLSFGLKRAGADTGAFFNPTASALFRFTVNDDLRLSGNARLTANDGNAAESWNLQADYRLAAEWSFLGRTTGQGEAGALRQVGFTYALLRERAAIEMLYGRQRGADETLHSGSLGLRLFW